jgi:GT2 family glycosyltransferase
MNYSVILTGYNRPQYLKEQVGAIMSQSIKPKDIYIWYNKPSSEIRDRVPGLKYIISECNFSFWGRFMLAQGISSDFIALFDDDTIPGNRWIQSCYYNFKKRPGIYGGNGILLNGAAYVPNKSIGWKSENKKTTEVDLVGHAWFFSKQYLKYFWLEEPETYETGEDIFFSYICQKYGNIKTYVPPHNSSSLSDWSSIKGARYGDDKNASYKTNKDRHYSLRTELVQKYIKRGWKPIFSRL